MLRPPRSSHAEDDQDGPFYRPASMSKRHEGTHPDVEEMHKPLSDELLPDVHRPDPPSPPRDPLLDIALELPLYHQRQDDKDAHAPLYDEGDGTEQLTLFLGVLETAMLDQGREAQSAGRGRRGRVDMSEDHCYATSSPPCELVGPGCLMLVSVVVTLDERQEG